jgi:enoyl-CoA hydratase/carnithine racemase
MAGTVELELGGPIAWVTLHHPGKYNAMSRSMWLGLRQVFEQLGADANLRCIVVRGAQGHFCAGGDISEYPGFRFDARSLEQFHEQEVWGALAAMLACDTPLVAQIAGNCMGAGVEIASCCDLRLAGRSSRFGAPIARLGFPMASREAALVTNAVGATLARAMLLAAEVFDADRMLQAGFLTHVVDDTALDSEVVALVERIALLAPAAARLNKQTFRASNPHSAIVNTACSAMNSEANQGVATSVSDPEPRSASDKTAQSGQYAYANSAEHREGITAFLEKRKPRF